MSPVNSSTAASNDWLRRYDAMSTNAAAAVMKRYSTSFSLATNLLPGQVKQDIRNLYAVVRIADEIVDGTASEAAANDIGELLSAYERAVLAAPNKRFHTDPILHAYANTARRCQFDPAHITAFFASMRRDLTQEHYRQADLDEYIYGSAEVIGLLCLAVFETSMSVTHKEHEHLDRGARALGAAFQKVNFLRDIGEDSVALGRAYFPVAASSRAQGLLIDDPAKQAIIEEIRADLAVAYSSMPLLPRRIRAGVMAAADVFSELTELITDTPAAELATRRIRVPHARKLQITTRAVVKAASGGRAAVGEGGSHHV